MTQNASPEHYSKHMTNDDHAKYIVQRWTPTEATSATTKPKVPERLVLDAYSHQNTCSEEQTNKRRKDMHLKPMHHIVTLSIISCIILWLCDKVVLYKVL